MKNKELIHNIVMALCELVAGILLLKNPFQFTSFIFISFGAVLIAVGILEMIAYFWSGPAEAFLRQSLAVGLAEIAAGLFCIFHYDWFLAAFPLLTKLCGSVTLVTGFVKVQWAVDMLRMKLRGWLLAAVSALLTLVFAWAILSNPFASTEALWLFASISLIVEAVVDIVVLIFRKRLRAG